MVRLLTRRHGVRGRQAQAIAWKRRRRTLGHLDPSRGLDQSHGFAAAASGFDVSDHFPDRSRPITIAVDVKREAATATGILFEAGDATTGLAIWLFPTPAGPVDVFACAGDVGDDGITLTAENVLQGDGQIARIVFSVIPGTGEARLWVEGELRASGTSVNGELPNGWAADSAAGVGEVSGAVTTRVPAAQRVTLADALMVTPVRAFDGQRPIHFVAGGGGELNPIVPSFDILLETGDSLLSELGNVLILED